MCFAGWQKCLTASCPLRIIGRELSFIVNWIDVKVVFSMALEVNTPFCLLPFWGFAFEGWSDIYSCPFEASHTLVSHSMHLSVLRGFGASVGR